MEFKNRETEYPGRYKLIEADNTEREVTLIKDEGIEIEKGTELSEEMFRSWDKEINKNKAAVSLNISALITSMLNSSSNLESLSSIIINQFIENNYPVSLYLGLIGNTADTDLRRILKDPGIGNTVKCYAEIAGDTQPRGAAGSKFIKLHAVSDSITAVNCKFLYKTDSSAAKTTEWMPSNPTLDTLGAAKSIKVPGTSDYLRNVIPIARTEAGSYDSGFMGKVFSYNGTAYNVIRGCEMDLLIQNDYASSNAFWSAVIQGTAGFGTVATFTYEGKNYIGIIETENSTTRETIFEGLAWGSDPNFYTRIPYYNNQTNTYIIKEINDSIKEVATTQKVDVKGYLCENGQRVFSPTNLPTALQTPCDIRIKENIEKADTGICLDSVLNIPVSRYSYKDFVGKRQDKHIVGFMADDVEKLYPKAINKIDKEYLLTDNFGKEITEQVIDPLTGDLVTRQKSVKLIEVKHINMEFSIPALWGAVQELASQIKNLKAELSEIKSR